MRRSTLRLGRRLAPGVRADRRTGAVARGSHAVTVLVGAFVLAASGVAIGDESRWVEPAMAPLWVTPDGHVVGAVFEPQRRPGLMRTAGDGTVDPAFNRHLFETTTLLAVAPDGNRIVYVEADGGQAVLRRALSSGLPDPTFGTGGAVAVTSATRVVADSQHRVLLLTQGGVIRFTADGERDLGWAMADRIGSADGFEEHDVALMPDDGIVTVATDGRTLRLQRFRPDGHPDPDWGRGGVADIEAPSSRPGWFGRVLSRPLAVFPDGSLSVAWTIGSVLPDGRVSRPFQTQVVRVSTVGSVQRQRLGFTSCSEERISVNAGPGGTTFVTGSLVGLAGQSSPHGSGFVAMFEPDLALVPSFGSGGVAVVDEPRAFTVLSAVDDPTHGRLLAGAASYSGLDRGAQPIPTTHRSVAIPRVWPAGSSQARADPCSPPSTSGTGPSAARGRAATEAAGAPTTSAPAREHVGPLRPTQEIAADGVSSQDEDRDRRSRRWIGPLVVTSAAVGAAALGRHRRREQRHRPVPPDRRRPPWNR